MMDPVGVVEIAARFGVTRSAVDQWRRGREEFPEPKWTVGGRPAWEWSEVERWGVRTGRLRK